MHTNRTKLMLMMAVVLALFASWIAYTWVQKRGGQAVAEAKVATETVVVANVEIPYGQKLEAPQLKVIEWPKNLVPEGAFKDIKTAEGKVASRTIFPDDIITAKRVADHLGGSHLAALIDDKKRAITVRVDDVIGVGGFLLPGNHVDVIGVRRITGSNEVIAKTVMKDVIVLAVDQEIKPDVDQPKVVRAVTLEMLPSSALKVVKAANEGKIHLLLRNPATKIVKKKTRTKKVVYRKPVKKQKKLTYNVNVIRGTERTNVKPKS